MSTRRAPRGYTYDPCPGCGVTPTPEQDGPRKANRVCFECIRKLKLAEETEKQLAERADLQLVHLAWAAHGQEYIGGDDCRPVQSAFWELGQTLGEVPSGAWRQAESLVPTDRNTYSSVSQDWPALSRMMAPAQIEAMRKLWDAVKAWGKRTEVRAKREGSSLLLQLASGEITAEQLNERSMRNKG